MSETPHLDFGGNRLKSSAPPEEAEDLVNLASMLAASLPGLGDVGSLYFTNAEGKMGTLAPPEVEDGPHPVLRYDYVTNQPYWDTQFNEDCEAGGE